MGEVGGGDGLSNAGDSGRTPLIQNSGFRRGYGLVIPAEAGIQVFQSPLDPGFRWGDGVVDGDVLSHQHWMVSPSILSGHRAASSPAERLRDFFPTELWRTAIECQT